VTSATPIDESTAGAIGRQLRPLLGGEPMIRRRVDPDVLGGIVVQVGDTIYDASLSTQLHNVRQQMMDRSAHEIQSRRDRFRNPEGN
jgi:F-type H+-transporting ATPase subunit delta